MANGITHAQYATRAATVITAGAIVAATVQPVLLGVAVGAWAGWLAGPDMDLHVKNEDRQRVWRYNKVLGVLWGWYWKPYDWMNGHRGRSHTIPAGTLDRFMLLFWLPVALSCYLWLSWWLPVFWVIVFVGQCCVDAVHLWLDGLL